MKKYHKNTSKLRGKLSRFYKLTSYNQESQLINVGTELINKKIKSFRK